MMQDMISRIRSGNFDYEKGTLDFSCSKIELTLPKSTIYEGSFHITLSPGLCTDGYVVSSDMRMECLTKEFSGSNAEIAYRFNGMHSEEGDVIKGSFYVCSSNGEYYLPFVVSIEHDVMDSSVGSIKNLFHFTNLAKSNWNEAVKLFYSEEFVNILTGSDAHYTDSYRALSANKGNEQNLDEFLIHINKKQPVEYSVSKQKIEATVYSPENAGMVTEKELEITKNGWGYTALNIECDEEFVFTDKEFLTEEDFDKNVCRLPLFIDTGACHRGVNSAKVYLFNSFISLEVEVEVRIGRENHAESTELVRKKLIAQLMHSYQDFRLKKVSTGKWLKDTGRLVERLASFDADNIESRLFQAQVLITEERYNEAGWILDHAADMIDNFDETAEKNKNINIDELAAYHWYLITLIHTEDEYVREASGYIEQIYRKNRDSWRIAWLLMYISDDYAEKPAAKWSLLEKLHNEGCTSPVIYLEAMTLINNNPPIVRKLDSFEIQVIHFCAVNNALSAGMIEQFLYLCSKSKEYSVLVLRVLKLLYEKNKDNRILQEICAMLIKGGRTGSDVADWYKAGITAQLRITNIYEYYMMSIDLEVLQDIPDMVIMYFSYQNNLDWERSAYLYHYILENRDRLPSLYAGYMASIQSFAIDQIQKKHINRHLAAIYREVLSDGMINTQTAESLAELLFAVRINITDKRIKKIYLYHPDSLIPQEYSVSDGNGWIAIYGSEYTIALEDAYGNRFTDSVEYTLEKLMLPGRFLPRLGAFAEDNVNFNLYMINQDGHTGTSKDGMEAVDAERCLDLILSNMISERLKISLSKKLLQYYYDNDDIRAMDICIESLKNTELTAADRAVILKYIIARGRYDTAYEWIKEYSPYYIEPKALLYFLDRLITEKPDEEDPVILAAAVYVFTRGKYNSSILGYLVRFYTGMTKNMRDIWKAAKSFDIDTYELCERMLIQMVYTGAYVGEQNEIFASYREKGAKEDVEIAFLSHCAYDYFVRERLTEKAVFDAIESMYLQGDEPEKLCRLAYLKYYGENPDEKTEQSREVAKEFLRGMLSEKIHLNFFREYTEFPELLKDMEDKTIIEYRVSPGAVARIHYMLVSGDEGTGEYKSEYMQEVTEGVCFKEFILFFGERLQYYIVEEKNHEEQLTESGTLQKSDAADSIAGSRFEMINDMEISKAMQDYETLDRLMEEYFRREFYNAELFQLI